MTYHDLLSSSSCLCSALPPSLQEISSSHSSSHPQNGLKKMMLMTIMHSSIHASSLTHTPSQSYSISRTCFTPLPLHLLCLPLLCSFPSFSSLHSLLSFPPTHSLPLTIFRLLSSLTQHLSPSLLLPPHPLPFSPLIIHIHTHTSCSTDHFHTHSPTDTPFILDIPVWLLAFYHS